MQETIIHKKIQKHNERMHTSKVCCETLLLYIYIKTAIWHGNKMISPFHCNSH